MSPMAAPVLVAVVLVAVVLVGSGSGSGSVAPTIRAFTRSGAKK